MNYNESSVIVNLNHAMLGSITPNWRAVLLKSCNDSNTSPVCKVFGGEHG
jgi:hypothetical protein